MENFMWDGASRVIFGKGVENETGKWVKKYGGKKVLFHYGGGSIKKSGLYNRVMKSLSDEKIEFIRFQFFKCSHHYSYCTNHRMSHIFSILFST